MTSPLVSVDWLKQHLGDPNLIVIDATMGHAVISPENLTEYPFIPGARHFDIDADFCDTDARFPHTIANEAQFTKHAQKLGINTDSILVVYDARGVYSAPRAWWLLTAMGHQNVKLLDGGLIAWQNAGFDTVESAQTAQSPGNFVAKLKENTVLSAESVLDEITNVDSTTIDVRGPKRFSGEAPEPRAGVRQGHIPSSINIPFNQVLNAHQFKSTDELKTLFSQAHLDHQQQLIFSCGSGITACIVLFAAQLAGYKHLSLFDGSWTEWGSRHELPIA